MDEKNREELTSLLTILPPVEFCCVYGSTLHPNNHDKSRMIDYILGVHDPVEWHKQNLEMNRNHYASWMAYLGGAKLITGVADGIGVGVHFNPFVSWNNKTFKYGVVRMHDLLEDIQHWERFYLSGRLQKPVNVLVDSLDVKNLNSFNLRAATSAALLLSPSKFTEEDLYAKICNLSYKGDMRMLFAEDRHKVNKIVQGQFDLFRRIYKPVLEEFASKDLLKFSSLCSHQEKITQDCGLPALQTLVSRLPRGVKGHMSIKLEGQRKMNPGQVKEFGINSRAEAANSVEKILRRKVMVSSVRQAVSGVLTVGAARATRYLANKMHKAWKSWH
ncbi:Phosphatidate cytidylyltransferase mitochondrial [Bienertia sinuspersici]